MKPRSRGIRIERAKVGVTATRSLRLPPPLSRPGKRPSAGQPFAHVGQVLAAFGGEGEVGAAEQLGAEDLFQLPHPVAHGAGRDAQFVGRQRHRAQPRQRLEGEEALDGRNARRVTASLEDHRLVAVQQHAVLAVPLHRAGQHLLSVSRPVAVRSSTV